jgi:hypothetical protein
MRPVKHQHRCCVAPESCCTSRPARRTSPNTRESRPGRSRQLSQPHFHILTHSRHRFTTPTNRSHVSLPSTSVYIPLPVTRAPEPPALNADSCTLHESLLSILASSSFEGRLSCTWCPLPCVFHGTRLSAAKPTKLDAASGSLSPTALQQS